MNVLYVGGHKKFSSEDYDEVIEYIKTKLGSGKQREIRKVVHHDGFDAVFVKKFYGTVVICFE